jgi:hypothetical protein
MVKEAKQVIKEEEVEQKNDDVFDIETVSEETSDVAFDF